MPKTANVLETRYNPAGYQIEQNGKTHLLTDLSREDLIQVACEQMETLEQFEWLSADMKFVVEQWRNGSLTKDDSDIAEPLLAIPQTEQVQQTIPGNVLESRYDPDGYQTAQNGEVFRLTELSREDLIQVTCEQMEALEQLDDVVTKIKELTVQWRKGEIYPADEEHTAKCSMPKPPKRKPR